MEWNGMEQNGTGQVLSHYSVEPEPFIFTCFTTSGE